MELLRCVRLQVSTAGPSPPIADREGVINVNSQAQCLHARGNSATTESSSPRRHDPHWRGSHARDGESAAFLTCRMPALPVPFYLSLRRQPRQHAVKVVGLDLHRLRELGNGQARPLTHQLERLHRARVTATPRRAGARPAGGSSSGAGTGRAGPGPTGTPATAPRSGKRGACGLKARHLITQLAQPVVNVPNCTINEFRHRCLLSFRPTDRSVTIHGGFVPEACTNALHDWLRSVKMRFV